MTMKIIAALAACTTLALAAGAARADPAIRLVADLTARTCLPALRTGGIVTADMMFPELQSVSDENLKTLNFTDGGRYWAVKGDDDIVFMELVENRCKVFTAKLGSAAFLPVLEEGIDDAFSKPRVVSDKAHPTNPTLRIRVYALDIDGEEGARIGVTYPTDATPEKGRMFYVSVVLTTTKTVEKP